MMEGTQAGQRNAIAIVGMSCRFPQANSPDELWSLLKNKNHTIAEIPKERWNADTLYDTDPQAEGKTHQRQASLLTDIHDFDPLFFNISPAEAIEMSPSQKLMLELAWEAIESSTIPFRKVRGNNVSVFVGNIWSDFEHYRRFKNARATLHSAVGMSSPVVANRVSFALGLTGASLVVDTGCSASLVALHLACQNLIHNESDMSIVGGINHILDPEKWIELTRFGGLSFKHRCSSFDKDADGFVRGEGGGALLLKRLADAERDGDHIFAVIRGTAVNNNGFNDTLPATSTEGQLDLLKNAYEVAGITPGEVHYVEAHGTGTKLGDPNEAKAIGKFFQRDRTHNLRIGSIKTNIGHTEATAGIAGLIKVVLAMKHNMLPANLNFNNPNPDIPFEELKLEVQKDATPWPAISGETYKAGVNSFGWGGTNAHAVLEQYISRAQEQPEPVTLYALPLSAKSPQGLLDYAKRFAGKIEQCDDDTFHSICVAAALSRAELDHRHIFSGTSREEVLAALNTFIAEKTEVAPAAVADQKKKVVFVFPGQGAQWLGMGRDLMVRERIFRETIEACDEAFRPFTDWSLLKELEADPATSRLNEISVVQPALFAMQIAFARLWMAWGLQPDAVVGHSMGEVAAAYISGSLSLRDAAKVICTRSRLMKTVAGTGGAMAVTELSREDADLVIQRYNGKLSVAVNNSPKSTVLAGDKNSIDEVLAELESRNLFCRLVKVDVASHSPQMDPLMEPLRAALADIQAMHSTVPFHSTVEARLVNGQDLDAGYWVNNLRGTVQFASVLSELMKNEHTVFVECNPHPVLVNAINECAQSVRATIIAIGSTAREKNEHQEMQRNLSELFERGCTPDWTRFYRTTKVPHVALPAYPFQRERYEIEDLSATLDKNINAENGTYPLLGSRINLANLDHTYFWESTISLQKFPFLKDHLVNGRIQLPTSCYMEIILEAMIETFGENTPVSVEDLVFGEHLWLGEKDRVDIQVKLLLQGRFSGKVTVHKKESRNGMWVALASGNIRILETNYHSDTTRMFEELEYQEPGYTEGINYYNLLRSIGFDFGQTFHHLTGLDKVDQHNPNKILFSISPADHVIRTANKYRIHPALLSSFFQPLLGQLTTILEEGNHMKVELQRIDEFMFEGDVNYGHEIRGLMVMHEMERQVDVSGTWTFSTDIIIANFDNSPVMRIRGLRGVAKRMVLEHKSAGQTESTSILDLIRKTSGETERASLLQQHLSQHVAGIVKISAARVKPTMTFKGMGLDSLMAVQLRNKLEQDFNMKIPVGMFWAHPTIKDYTSYLLNLITGAKPEEIKSTHKEKRRDHSKWFSIPKPAPDAAFRLFCFHDAGGSASLFEGWENYFDSSFIEFVAVELPGRGRRLNETPVTDTVELISELTPLMLPLLDKPFAFLGHSMGGLVAFEIMHELRKQGRRLPEKLFISSTSGLNAYEKNQVDYTLNNDELVKLYPHLDLSVVGDEELQQMLIQILRADLQLLHSHQYRFEVPFNVPILAIHGEDDQRVSRYQIEQWEKETFTTFRLVSRPGGHRYIEHDAPFVTGIIQEQMQEPASVVTNFSQNGTHRK